MIIIDLCWRWRLQYARIDHIHRVIVGPVCIIFSPEYHNNEDLRFAICDTMNLIRKETKRSPRYSNPRPERNRQ